MQKRYNFSAKINSQNICTLFSQNTDHKQFWAVNGLKYNSLEKDGGASKLLQLITWGWEGLEKTLK